MKRGRHVPRETVELGTVLEAAILVRGKVHVVHEWRGMRLLSDADCFTRERPRLYLVRGKPIPTKRVDASQAKVDHATESYERWHKRAAQRLYELDTKPVSVGQGRMVRLDYRSDKWHRRGRTIEYTHDFTELGGVGPLVTTDSKAIEKARTVVCSGGSMRVTEAGIA